jgi:hypothetical protein
VICADLGQLGGDVHVGCGAESERVMFITAPLQESTDAFGYELDIDRAIQAVKTGNPYPMKMWIFTYANPVH